MVWCGFIGIHQAVRLISVYQEINTAAEPKIKNYDVRAVPTIIIDEEIKVVGIPDFPWICGDDLYKILKRL